MHTCAAVATAPGKAGISVIRLSGDDSINIADKVFKCVKYKSLLEVQPNKAVYGNIVSANGEVIDSGLCTCFHAPHSYTGENTVEISCHGSPIGTSLVLSALLTAGAVPALPGEFTKRAFVNGKLDLTQAEAVGQLIDAQSAAALKLSQGQLSGAVSQKTKACAEEITTLLASVYAYIDYPDEDMTDIPPDEMKLRIAKIRDTLQSLTNSYSTGVAVNEGVRAAIVGKPNAGKSSFLNMMLGFERAIVTDVAGTTRDVVSEKVTVGNIMLKLSDTAGLRATDDTVEKIGVTLSYEEMEKSDVVFAMFDASDTLDDGKELIQKLIDYKDTKGIVIVLNKSDIADVTPHKAYFEALGFDVIVTVCAKNGEGKEQVENAVKMLYPESENIEGQAILTNARQYAALMQALESTKRAMTALELLTPDTACLDLEQALAQLLEADGRQVSEKIVESIFSHFCVGK